MSSNGLAAVNSDKPLTGNGRVAVHTFDENASPEQKAAQAGKARDQLKSVQNKDEQAEREVHVDKGGAHIVPTITVQDADAEPSKGVQPPPTQVSTVPGDMPSGPAPSTPDWYRIGWRQASGIDEPVTEGEQKDRGILDHFLSEQFYGAWYHNAAIIIFAVFASHFLTRFHFGWGWLFILLAVCNTYYSTSMERVRRRARDDIQRELVKTRLASEHETADWMNNFLDRFWLIYEPVLSATIVNSVEQILSTNTPAFLDSLRLTQFTLGTKAPRIDRVRTFPKTADDIVMMDWEFSFTPNDTSDMTPKQVALKYNPRIVLSVRVGKGLATASMPILLEDINFSGKMRVQLKLMSNFPHVQIVDLSFLERPVIDYVLKPIGGETFGLDIAHIPGLSSFIREMTHGTLGPMMYDPNVFTLNLEQMLSGTPLDSAIGVLQVTIHAARGIKGTKIGGGTPDPFVGLCFNNRAEVAHTKYKSDTYNPTWTETKFILVNSLTDMLVFNLWDYNDHRKNTLLGSASFELSKLQEDATQEGLVSQLLKDGKDRGELRYDVSFYPVLTPAEGEGAVPETTIGIVRLTIHQAKELDQSKSLSGDLNPVARLYLGGNDSAIHSTKLCKHTNSPVWESAHEFLCADRTSSVITVRIIDDRDFLSDPVVGYMSIRLNDLLESKKSGRDWFPLSNCKSGKIRVSAEWKPLNMAGSLHSADQYSPPIGVVRLFLEKATEVKNVEATLGGKSDPYVRVQVNNVTKSRTEVINNNLNPVWEQFVYIPVHSVKETLFLECMDYQHLTRDRSLGSAELRVADLVTESDDSHYHYHSTGIKNAAEPLRQDKGSGFKGNLHFTAEFVPTLKLKWNKFDTASNEMQTTGDNSDEEGGTITSASSSLSDQAAPEGVTIHLNKTHTKGAKSTDTTGNEKTVDLLKGDDKEETQQGSTTDSPPELTIDELLTHQSGVIVFNVVSGTLSKKARLEILLDDAYWPCFNTVKPRSTQARWDHVGEGFLKELDFGQVWLRLNDAEEGAKDNIIAQWKGEAKAFLKSALAGPESFSLDDSDGKATSSVTIEARYIPVHVTLDPRESINNQGVLRVDLLDGHDIMAADRGGKSDPFAVFAFNGQRVFKSQTKKKTLNPEWNENFVVQVPSRVGADFNVELFDWNQIEQAKSLGSSQINLEDLEPFHAVERQLSLTSAKHGDKGYIRVRLMFQPEIIVKSRKNTSTFSTAGRAMTQFGGLPVTASKGVVHGVAGVFGKKHKDDDELMVAEGVSGQASRPIGVTDFAATAFPSGEPPSSGHEPGALRVTVVTAKDIGSGDYKPYVTVRVADKEFKTKHGGKTATPEWNESFVFTAGPATEKLYVWVHDHKTLGRDKLLGEGEVDIWRHINNSGVSAAEVLVELAEGQGQLTLRLEFDPTTNPDISRVSTSSDGLIYRTMSMSSPSRFSLRGRRPGADKDDSD